MSLSSIDYFGRALSKYWGRNRGHHALFSFRGRTTADNEGLGASSSNDLSGQEDAYDLYRKRMMLAYRFRPNPLNNPRRPYY